jgi:outer membrane protein assembly factor BamA
MRFITKKLLTLAALLTPAIAGAEEPADSTKDEFQRLSAVPIVGYTEETQYQLGAMAILFFKPDFPGGNVHELDLSFYGTSRNQVTGSISPKFFFLNDRISSDIDLHYEDWVGNYFGSGNDPDYDDFRKFDRKSFYFTALVETNFGTLEWVPSFKYGLFLELNNTQIEFQSYTGKLQKPTNINGWRNGMGYHLSFDTRDNTNWARHGYLVQWGQYFYNTALSDFGYTHQELDLRGYSEFIWNTSMAVGFLWQRVDGDVPFDKLAGSDGLKRFRGVEKNYFCGNQAIFLQVEFRKKLFWRLAGDIFFEGGKTGDYFSDLMRNKWHRSVGFGGRFALNQKENLYARCELSWVDFKHVGMTMYVRDAF